MSKCFPELSFLHLAWKLKKYIFEKGLTRECNNNPNSALEAKIIIVLSFVPV